MFRPYSFFQNARKIVNLRFKLSRQAEESKLAKLRQHPAVNVLVMGLAIAGLASFGQYLSGDTGTKVQVITHQEEVQPATPSLAKEPAFIPEGSPTAPADVPVEVSPVPVMTTANTAQEEQPGSTGPEWARSRAPIRGQLTGGFTFGYAAFFDDYRLHSGLDYTAPKGTPVTAVLGGTVEAIYQHELFGPMITITHGEGWKSYYAPVEDVEVVLGQWVDTGFQLGRLGPPPPAERDKGTHLHFELHQHGEPVDPALYIK
jgi:murein DD-endopeptidase MepM/ murein hydrolase activator NlpD